MDINNSKDTGDCKYGNFYNYYEFNKPERRITLLPSTILSNLINNCIDKNKIIYVLDIGCNSGVRRYIKM